jgi:transcriptional regulator with XRE-family HTH domain
MGKVLKNLKEIREKKLLTQQELSNLCGSLSVKSISKAERGHGVALSTVKKLAKILETKPENLIGI